MANDGARSEIEALQRRVSELERALAEARDRARPMADVERDLLAQKKLLRTVLDEIPDVIVLKDHRGNFLLSNKTVADLYGTTPDAMVGKDDGDFSASREQAEFFRQNVLGIMARMETEIVLEESTDSTTGDVRTFRSIKKPFLGDDGKPQILVIAHDITDIQRAQRKVASSERRLSYVLQATGEGVWDWDLVTNRVVHNDRWAELLGFEANEIGSTMADFEGRLLPEDRPDVFAAVQRCLRGEGPYKHEHRMLKKDGSTIWVIDRGDVVERAPDGTPLRMVGSFADLTERRRAEEHIERVNANLEQLVDERTQALTETLERLKATQQEFVEREKLAALGGLVAGVAHEINTPVGVAVTASSLLGQRTRELAEKFGAGQMKRSDLEAHLGLATQLSEVIHTNLGRAASLVKSFQQVAARQSSNEVEDFSLLEAVQAAVDSFGPELKHSAVKASVDGDASIVMRAAPGFVFQVVGNLVTNALRHAFPEGRAGHIHFTVERVGAGCCVRYVDDGVGMSAETHARMFEPFFTTRRGKGGTGLGLHIVWNLITGHLGGRIESATEVDRGLSMALYLPCLPRSEAA